MSNLNATHVYQAIYFDNQIKKHYYPGDAFMEYRESLSMEELLAISGDIMEEDGGKIMPKLTEQIELLLGEGNYISDFWEFGPDCFSLYWWIRKEVYREKVRMIRKWAEYEGISEWMEINEKVVK